MKKLLFITLLTFSTLASSAEHEVKMLNFGTDGGMVFEPGFLKVNVGDTVNFKAIDLTHNTESVAGLIPDGAPSGINPATDSVLCVRSIALKLTVSPTLTLRKPGSNTIPPSVPKLSIFTSCSALDASVENVKSVINSNFFINISFIYDVI